jgi:hypothetical protein
MSMICWVLELSPSQIGALRATPSLASDLAKVTQDEQLKARLAEAMNRMPPKDKGNSRSAVSSRNRTDAGSKGSSGEKRRGSRQA